MKLEVHDDYFYRLSSASVEERLWLLNRFSWEVETKDSEDLETTRPFPFVGELFHLDDILPTHCVFQEKRVTEIKIVKGETKVYFTTLRKMSVIGDFETKALIPWGLLDEIPDIEIDERPVEERGPIVTIEPDFLDGITLYDFQVAAIRKSIYAKRGIVSVSTGGGKTEIIAGIVKYSLLHGLYKKIVIVTPNVTNCDQLYDRLRLRGVPEDQMGKYKGSSRDNSKTVVVGVINSLRMDIFERPESKGTLVIVDEGHHSVSTTWYNFIIGIKPESLLCFSGSIYEHEEGEDQYMSGFEDCLLKGLFGRVIIEIDQVALRAVGLLALPVVHMKRMGTAKFMGKNPGFYNRIYESNIVKNETRNLEIVKYTKFMLECGLSVLILVQRHDHGLRLLEKIQREDTICVFGGSIGHQYEHGEIVEFDVDDSTLASNVRSGATRVIIATQVFDEGVDIPSIGAVIMAGGGKVKRRNIQRIGRGVRKKIGEPNRVFILDFWDNGHIYMRSHSRKRHEVYVHEKIQSSVIESEDTFKMIMTKQKRIII